MPTVKYMGSKSRIAKHIVPIIQSYIDTNQITTYIEPFCGGANVIDKIKCHNRIASDSNPYLIALLQRVQSGKPLLESVDRTLYNEVRANYLTGEYENWYVGNVGFLASYNGRWFDGGYAAPGFEKTKNGSRYRDYYQESKRNILEQAGSLQDIVFECKDYHEYDGVSGALIYCDPPYANTKKFANAVNFDYDDFWDTIRKWSKTNIVIVSEESAPPDFCSIWQRPVSRSIKATDKSTSVEQMFVANAQGVIQ